MTQCSNQLLDGDLVIQLMPWSYKFKFCFVEPHAEEAVGFILLPGT